MTLSATWAFFFQVVHLADQFGEYDANSSMFSPVVGIAKTRANMSHGRQLLRQKHVFMRMNDFRGVRGPIYLSTGGSIQMSGKVLDHGLR